MTIREAIAKRMEEKCVTQTALSELADISQQNISEYLRGERELRSDRVERLLQALGLEVKPKETKRRPKRKTGR